VDLRTPADARRPRFGILGPLDVTAGGRRTDLGGPKQRELLAVLLIHPNHVVSADRLVQALWGDDAPAGAEVTLRTHVSHLRRRLAGVGAVESLVTRRPGYGLFLDPEQVDAFRFERLAGQGQEALGLGEPERAEHLLREALRQWRGPVLQDLGQPPFAESETARLDELRQVTLESRIEADLALGRHRDVVGELEGLVAAHPYRERTCAQLMLALYRSGRQVDALTVYSAARQRLVDELGLDPGPVLSELEKAILRHDPALLPAATAAAAPASGTREARRSRVRQPPDALFDAVRRTRMVGRSAELDRLRALWQAVRDGGRRVALVSGEAGVGKTRLVAEFAAGVAEDDAVILVGRSAPVTVVPYQPLTDALRASADVDDALADAPAAVRTPLAALLHPSGGSPPARPQDAADARPALFDAVEWLLGRVAAAAPVVLVLEECERIDSASALLLRHLVGRLPERVLVVVCFRDPPGSRHGPLLELLGELEGRGTADRLTLRPLPEADLGALVTALTGTDAAAGVVHRLWRNTGGNPFYATEVVRDLDARGELSGSPDWQVPSGVGDVLRHRLRALPDDVQQAVRGAAVLGREVTYDLLPPLVDQPEDVLVESLDRAVAAGFLVVAGQSWQVSYAFPHELTRDAVYAEIPLPRRQRLHLRAARTLQERGPARGEDVMAAAAHLRAAGAAADPPTTADLSLRAADEASRLYAWDEAVVHADAAVEILEHAGAPPERVADAAVRAANLRLKAGVDHRGAVRHLETALQRYRTTGDDAALAAVHSRIGGALCTHHSVMDIPRAMEHFDAAQRLLADHQAAAFHLHRGTAQAAMYGVRTEILGDAADRAVELADRLGRRDLGVFAGWGRAWFRFNRGELAGAAATHEEMWATAHQLGDPYLGWASVNAAALQATEYRLDPRQGRAWCRRGLTQPRFDSFTYPHDTVVDQLVLAMAAMGEVAAARRAAAALPPDAVSRRLLGFLEGDWERAEQTWAAALEADEAAGDLLDAALNARWLAGARLALGDGAGAAAALRRSLVIGVEGPQVPTELAARAELARILATDGRGEDAAAHLARCDEILAGGEDWGGLVGVVELARGAVAAGAGDSRGSGAAHERALEIFAAHHLPWRRAGALHAWARLLLAAGDREAATAKRRAVGELYDQVGAAPRWRRPLDRP
jgi:DNA-binding SARP family transcriptional activator